MSAPAVLVLDGHTNQALACVRSLGRARFDVLVASHRRLPLASWSTYSRARFRLADQSVESFRRARDWASKHGVRYVLPLTERSCLLLNVERDEWEAAGMVLGCGAQDMLGAAFDKSVTVRMAQSCGIHTPPTWFPRSMEECRDAAEEVGFPCVVKARFSNAWNGTRFVSDRGTRYVANVEELERAVLASTQGECWPLIQGFVAGEGEGVFTLFDRGTPVVWFAHERLRDVRPAGSGSSLRRSVALDPELRAPAERLLAAMNWHGPAMVEFRVNGDRIPYLMEVNGRFWGSLQLAVSAGVDFPRLWMALLEGRSVEAPNGYVEGATLRWLWGDVKRFVNIVYGPPPGFPGRYPTILQGLKELVGPQPPGTHLETWDPKDRWPAVGEWVQGFAELVARS